MAEEKKRCSVHEWKKTFRPWEDFNRSEIAEFARSEAGYTFIAEEFSGELGNAFLAMIGSLTESGAEDVRLDADISYDLTLVFDEISRKAWRIGAGYRDLARAVEALHKEGVIVQPLLEDAIKSYQKKESFYMRLVLYSHSMKTSWFDFACLYFASK